MSVPSKPRPNITPLAIFEETLPPHNLEAESGVLGSMLLDNSPRIFKKKNCLLLRIGRHAEIILGAAEWTSHNIVALRLG